MVDAVSHGRDYSASIAKAANKNELNANPLLEKPATEVASASKAAIQVVEDSAVEVAATTDASARKAANYNETNTNSVSEIVLVSQLAVCVEEKVVEKAAPQSH